MSDDVVTKDLMRKVADDVDEVIKRVLSISPKPYLPILLAAAGSALVALCWELDQLAGNTEMDSDNLLLAGLIVAETVINADKGVEIAYEDLKILKKAKR